MNSRALISLTLIALTLPASWMIFVGKNGFYEGLYVIKVGSFLVATSSFSELKNNLLEEGTLFLTVDSSGKVSGSYKVNGMKPTSILEQDGKIVVLGYLAGSGKKNGIMMTWRPGDDFLNGLIIRNSSVTHSMARTDGELVLVGSVEISDRWSPFILKMGESGVEEAFTISGSEGIEAYDSAVKEESIALVGASYSSPGMVVVLLRGSRVDWSREVLLKGARLEPNSISFGSSDGTIAVAGTAWMGDPKRSDGFVAIFDGNGTLLNFLLVGGNGGNQLYKVGWDPYRGEFIAVGMGGCFVEGGCDVLAVKVASKGDRSTGLRLGTTKVEKASSVLPLEDSYVIAGTSEGDVTRSLFYSMFARISKDGSGCLPKREFNLAMRHVKPEVGDLKVILTKMNLATESKKLKVEEVHSLEIWNPCFIDPYYLRGIAILIIAVAAIFITMAYFSKRFIAQVE